MPLPATPGSVPKTLERMQSEAKLKSPTQKSRMMNETMALKRESSALLKLDMRLPGRVKAELKAGKGEDKYKGGRAVKEFVDKGNIRPVLLKTSRHETLRRYFEDMDKDQGGTLDFQEMRRWLPKIGLDNEEFAQSVQNHFNFMDKDGSEEVDFKEFALATIDAADQVLSSYEDEQYAAAFGMEIYMFLALCARTKALRSYEKDADQTYDEGNELLPFIQFERLLTVSQSCFMPYDLFQAEDSTKERRSTMGGTALTPQQQAMRAMSSRGFTDRWEEGGEEEGVDGGRSSDSGCGGSEGDGEVDSWVSDGGDGARSTRKLSPLSPPVLKMGYEDLWGLRNVAKLEDEQLSSNAEVAAVQKEMQKNRRQWAIQKRAEIIGKAQSRDQRKKNQHRRQHNGNSRKPARGLPLPSGPKSTTSPNHQGASLVASPQRKTLGPLPRISLPSPSSPSSQYRH